MKKIIIEKDLLYFLYIDCNLTVQDISELIKCDVGVIRRNLKQFNIPYNTERKINIDKDLLIYLYILCRMGSTEISKLLRCNTGVVKSRLHEFNIPMRTNSESHKGLIYSEEARKNNSISHKGMLTGDKNPAKRPELRKRNSDAHKGKPSPRKGCHFTIEQINKISNSRKGKSAGDCHWNWKGGISKKYCYKFNEQFREYIRNKFGKKCFICNKLEHENYTKNNKLWKLSIHHIDYNKNSICNGKEWAFVPLCTRCHMKTNSNQWYWFNLLINYWALNTDDKIINFNNGEIFV